MVRRMVGYRRFEGLEAVTLLAKLYRSVRLFVNFFQPSFKLIAKQRDGACVRKTYSPPATPHQRLVADARTSDLVRSPVCRKSTPNSILSCCCAISAPCRNGSLRLPILRRPCALTGSPADRPFPGTLRTAWKDGAIRPTDRPIGNQKGSAAS